MGVAVYLPLLAAAVLGAGARALARLLPPATAARWLTAAAVLVSASASFVLGVLAFTLLGKLPPVAAAGRWSVAALSVANPVPQGVAAAACAAVVVLGASGVRAAWRRACAVAAARQLCERLGGGAGQLVVLDDDSDDVFAVPGHRGRIVASRSLLAALPTDERRALLAHEAAHLQRHHHLYRTATELAAAVCPMLQPVVHAVRFATERWADEDAARSTGDRTSVARALARVGLRRHDARAAARGWRSLALDAAGTGVAVRVRALLAPPPRQGRLGTLALLTLVALLAVTVASAVDAQRDAEHLFEGSRPPSAGSTTISPHR